MASNKWIAFPSLNTARQFSGSIVLESLKVFCFCGSHEYIKNRNSNESRENGGDWKTLPVKEEVLSTYHLAAVSFFNEIVQMKIGRLIKTTSFHWRRRSERGSLHWPYNPEIHELWVVRSEREEDLRRWLHWGGWGLGLANRTYDGIKWAFLWLILFYFISYQSMQRHLNWKNPFKSRAGLIWVCSHFVSNLGNELLH